MSRKRPLPGPGQKGSLLYFLKNQPSQKRQTNTLSEQPEQSDQIIETTGQQTEEQHTGQREPETGQREQQTGQTSRGATDRTGRSTCRRTTARTNIPTNSADGRRHRGTDRRDSPNPTTGPEEACSGWSSNI